MRERPILFNDAMVREILSGAKTQTRRPIRQHRYTDVKCPFGVPGDRLWVRECFGVIGTITDLTDQRTVGKRVMYRADGENASPLRWRPSIHMPHWASRLTLRVTDVRVERVQDISEEDAEREGFLAETIGYMQDAHGEVPIVASARGQFESTWTGVYGPESWTANPWVWCVSFEREEVPRG